MSRTPINSNLQHKPDSPEFKETIKLFDKLCSDIRIELERHAPVIGEALDYEEREEFLANASRLIGSLVYDKYLTKYELLSHTPITSTL